MVTLDAMSDHTRIRAGIKAQGFGELFERIFKRLERDHLTITRMPDGCRHMRGNKIIRVKTPFDWIVSYKDFTGLFDTKTTETDSFAHSAIVSHQVLTLAKHHRNGTHAGYVLWFRKTDSVIFMPASQLLEISSVRGSINEKNPHATLLGTVRDGIDLSRIFECTL